MSKSPFKTLTSDQKPRFFTPLEVDGFALLPAHQALIQEAQEIISGDSFEIVDVVGSSMTQEEREQYVRDELSVAISSKRSEDLG